MSISTAINKNSKVLTLFALACTATVGIVNELTKDKIYQQEQLQLLSTFNQIIETDRYNNELALDCVKVTDERLGSDDAQTIYLARFNSSPVAAAIKTNAPQGYSGNISLIVAVNIDGSVKGVRALAHKETPGLGDKIDIKKSDWINSFIGKKIESENDSRWSVSKDGGMFDQFTGATITPRAVVKAVKNTTQFFNEKKHMLFSLPNECRVNRTSDESISEDVKPEDVNPENNSSKDSTLNTSDAGESNEN